MESLEGKLDKTIRTGVQREQSIVEVIDTVPASYKELPCLFDSILEENHGQAFISVVPKLPALDDAKD